MKLNVLGMVLWWFTIVICLVALVVISNESGYESGQMDGLNGIWKYKKVKVASGTIANYRIIKIKGE